MTRITEPHKKQETKVYRETQEVVRRNLIGLRKQRNLYQRELAELMGVTQQAVYLMEKRGTRLALPWICNAFHALGSPIHLPFPPAPYSVAPPRHNRAS